MGKTKSPLSTDNVLLNLLVKFHEKDYPANSMFNPNLRRENIREINPITLQVIEDSLIEGHYRSKYWLFIEHVTKALTTIMKNFNGRSRTYIAAFQCLHIFTETMDVFMKCSGYCCGIYREQKSRQYECSSSKKCCIDNETPVFFRYKLWTFCEKCFTKVPGQDFPISDDLIVNKSNFDCCIYKEKKPESFINCIKCKRQYHEKCVLHPKYLNINYICKVCLEQTSNLRQIILSSECIPRTECDIYIQNYMRATKIDQTDKIIIRMITNMPTKFRPKKMITKYRQDMHENTEIMYNNCGIFVFLKLPDNTEICFFGFYLQLYGNSNCPDANKNTVYLSLIDSVKLPCIRERTRIYQVILFGLFEYLQKKNFQKVFIWSCPPRKDDDYIFNMKPPTMRIPTQQKLNQWYMNLMRNAAENKCIWSYSGVRDHARKANWKDLNNIPYFENDLWPLRLEEAIFEAEKKCKVKMSRDETLKYINILMDDQIYGFNDRYYCCELIDSSDSQFEEATMPETVSGFCMDKSHIVDIFEDLELNFMTERSAKFSTILLVYKLLLESSTCYICGIANNHKESYLHLICSTCSHAFELNDSNMQDEPGPSSVVVDTIDLTISDSYDFTSEPFDIVDLTNYEEFEDIDMHETLSIIDLCDFD